MGKPVKVASVYKLQRTLKKGLKYLKSLRRKH
jgi:hypothetical protein